MRDHLQAELRSALVRTCADEGLPEATDINPTDIDVEYPRNLSHGDWASNVALVMAKTLRRPPRQLAEQLADHLRGAQIPHVQAVEVAGPGFLNFHLSASWLHDILRDVVSSGTENYARHSQGEGTSVSVEFVSANPTGPLHAGHSRWAAYGDSLCRLLERCGFHVVREFYINDRGRQISLFAESLVARRRGEDPSEEGYQGDYVTTWAAKMPADADPEEWGLQKARQTQEATLNKMNVAFDLWVSERELVARGAMDEVLAELRDHGMVYESDGATWLRTSRFEDDTDRVLIRSNGEPTYFLPDIAYHHEKFSRCELVIDILGADHHGYINRMRSAMLALGHDSADYEVLVGQNAVLRRDNTEVRLSKRAGTMVLASDLIDEIGPDVTRLTYLLQSIDTTQTIDIDLLKAQSAENPVYYLQYAHARIRSLARKAETQKIVRIPLEEVDLSVLEHKRELDILRALESFPDTVLTAMKARAPHRVTSWARELAAVFHRFWHDCPILHPDTAEDVRQARLWLVESARIGLSISLEILGVSAPEHL